jgi:isopentenyl-diphosphate delta-isomerase
MTADEAAQTKKRKGEHVKIATRQNVQARATGTGLEAIRFAHYALPELDYQAVQLGTTFLGRRLDAPFMVISGTGGFPDAERINRSLARACEEHNVSFQLGSQRAMIVDPSLLKTYKVRDVAPKVHLVGNIGITQLRDLPLDKIASALSLVEADALAVHLNPLQEAIQPEGDKDFRHCLAAIAKACDKLSVPVLAKEVGAGINGEVALELENAGVKAIDVSGVGGTSWAAIELKRKGAAAGETFWDWGVPTAEALRECAQAVKVPLIVSGGVRTGLDVAKGIRLGASLGAAAMPFVRAAVSGGAEGASAAIQRWKDELRIAMFCTRSKDLAALRRARLLEG